MYKARSPLQVSLHVWHALFMREASARISGDRLGWTWVFIEPLAHILLFVAIRQLVGKIRHISGAEFIPWFIVGMSLFIMFNVVMNRCMGAISASRALFAYRQLHPVDTIIVRAVLEMLIKLIVLMMLVLGASFLGYEMIPADALFAGGVWLSVWMLGIGFGLTLSAVTTTIPELAKFVGIVSFPLYFLSGVMLPIQYMPHGLRDYLMLNPLLHAVESFRMGFFGHYQSVNGISMMYVWFFALSLILLGLMLQIRWKNRLMAQ